MPQPDNPANKFPPVQVEPEAAARAELEVLAALQAAHRPSAEQPSDAGRTFTLPQGTFKVSAVGPKAGLVRK